MSETTTKFNPAYLATEIPQNLKDIVGEKRLGKIYGQIKEGDNKAISASQMIAWVALNKDRDEKPSSMEALSGLVREYPVAAERAIQELNKRNVELNAEAEAAKNSTQLKPNQKFNTSLSLQTQAAEIEAAIGKIKAALSPKTTAISMDDFIPPGHTPAAPKKPDSPGLV